jgi:hypothetical protein
MLPALLKIMVMLDDAPDYFTEELLPQHGGLCPRDEQLWAQLPVYLEQKKAGIAAHCRLHTLLQALVIAYAATAPGDM